MTTIVADRVDATIIDPALERHPYFSWGAAIAGALAASLVTFMLLAVGAGLGLILSGPVNNPAPLKTILTAGGIYFFAVEAFGFAVGGYIAGRLCGPVLQSRDEEMFRSGAHGLVAWALSAGMCLVFLTIGAGIATSAASNLASAFGMSATRSHDSTEPTPAVVQYWTDWLFRAPGGTAPSTMAPTGTAAPTTAPATTPAPTPTAPSAAAPAPAEVPVPGEPMPNADTESSGAAPAPSENSAPDSDDNQSNSTNTDQEAPVFAPSPAVYVPGEMLAPAVLTQVQYTTTTSEDGSVSSVARTNGDTHAQVNRILTANAASPRDMPPDDRQFIEQSIVTETGVSQADARQRLDALLSRIHDRETKAAETARKAAAYLNIWMGLALFFGLLVATAAAILARMEEEEKGEEAGSVRVAPTVTPPPAAAT